ncbi:glycosyltransferase [Actinoplanes sp. NBC_00393]|uniref:glycosyltransferase n=1 Tax=Actinoplanes sp. NBC_00393 TaxID=2975953 RepID=UPI002E2059B8
MTSSRPKPPRLLYIAFYFPPSRASGVYRARATANHFAAAGWDVTVFAAPLRFLYHVIGSVDEKLSETVDPRIKVERPELDLSRWENELHNMTWLEGTLPEAAKKLRQWREDRYFPEVYASWARDSVTKALRMHKTEKFDAVLATGNPFAAFAAAWEINKKTGIPYVADYRDSWTLDLFSDEPAFPPEHAAWRWEKRIIGDSSATVFVNNALRAWHADRYPASADRMLVVPNGWDPDLLEVAAGDGAESANRPLRFGYLGTVTSKQPVVEMAEAFRQAREYPDLHDAELNIHGHLGFFKQSHAAFLPLLGLDAKGEPDPESDHGLRLRGPVSKTEVAGVYEHNDVLVFLAAGGKYVTSGKIFEYMAAGKPIVSVHAPEIAAREVLEGYPLWFTADSLDPGQVAKSMVEAGRAARTLTPQQQAEARAYADRFQRDKLLDPLEHAIRGMVRRPIPAAEVQA